MEGGQWAPAWHRYRLWVPFHSEEGRQAHPSKSQEQTPGTSGIISSGSKAHFLPQTLNYKSP